MLKGKLSTLRPWKIGDEEGLVKVANNPKIAKNLIYSYPNPYTLADAKEYIKSCQDSIKTITHFAIIVDKNIAGAITFSFKDEDKKHTVVLGYWIGEEYWGRGITPEAIRLVTKYAFENCNIERMEAKVYTWNPNSAKVLLKAGFTFEGVLRKSTLKAGSVVDEWIYSITREEVDKLVD